MLLCTVMVRECYINRMAETLQAFAEGLIKDEKQGWSIISYLNCQAGILNCSEQRILYFPKQIFSILTSM